MIIAAAHEFGVPTPRNSSDRLTLRGTAGADGVALASPHSNYDAVVVVTPVIAGAIAMSLVSENVGAIVLAGLLLTVGSVVAALISGGPSPELRAYVLTFGCCLTVAAVVQCYSTVVFGEPMSTIDAWTFYYAFSANGSTDTLETLEGTINAPLAVILWQTWYAVAKHAGFGADPWIGIQLNSSAVAMAAALAVKCARELFGTDPRRLRQVANLCACSGMFWLFGALLLRDCFSLLFATLNLWAMIRWLNRPASVLTHVVIVAVFATSAICLRYLREEAVYQTIALGILAALVKISFRSPYLLPKLALAAAVGLGSYVLANTAPAIAKAVEKLTDARDGYENLGAENAGSQSLGLKLILKQPLPIRVLIGSVTLIVNPLPLWGGVVPEMPEYQMLKTYQGLYLVLLMPSAVLGMVTVFRGTQKIRGRCDLVFLAFYSVVTLSAVAATSLESRHHGQFIVALILLAVVADTSKPKARAALQSINKYWWQFVMAIHLAWVFLKLS